MILIKRGLIIFCLLLLSGCLQTKVIEDLHLSQLQGYDEAEAENETKVTASVPIYGQGEKNSKAKDVQFTATSHTSQSVRVKLQAKAPFPIEFGKIKGLVFGNEYASKKGIYDVIDVLSRDPEIGRMIYMAVVDGTAQELLNQQFKKEGTLSRYIKNLLDHNIDRNLPTSNLHEFIYSYYGHGMDPFLPLIVHEEDAIKIKGLALFDNDHYVDSIPLEDLFVFKILYEKAANAKYEYHWKERDSYVGIDTVSSNVKYKTNKDQSVTVSVKVKGILRDSPTVSTGSADFIKTIENKISKSLEKKGRAMIKSFQEKGIDPLRLGDHVRSQTRGWKHEEWREKYPDKEIHVNVDLSIRQTGISE